MTVNISEDDIAEAIAQGELSLSDIVHHLARELLDEELALLEMFDAAGKALKDARLADAAREFGDELSSIATRFHEKLLKEETDQ